MVFLELRRDSRVTTGNSGCLLCWPRQVQSSTRVAKESCALLSSDCRANRPHSDAGRDWGQEEKGTTEDEMLDGITNSMDVS